MAITTELFQVPAFWIGVVVIAGSAIYTLYKLTSGTGDGGSSAKKSSKKMKNGHPVALQDSDTKYPLKLVEKKHLSHDTRLYRFALPSDNHVLGLPTGQHIHLSARVNESLVVRPYTPGSHLNIFTYFRNVHPKFPDGGKLTQYLNDLPIGHTIDCRGPSGRLIYNGRGEFAIRADKKSEPVTVNVTKVNMIAGGSGITPMLQIVKHVFKDSKDPVSLSLLFANQTEEDILCREDLEKIRDEQPDRFKLWYTLDRPPTDWKYSTGFISAEMVKDHFFPPSNDTLVLMCGPPPMINFACTPALDKLGYEEKLRFAY
ncbi:NADH-cytochrome b5 reductase 2 [Folsomia candida]|uniref:NADH-cytochrome b5 reductase n=1 Tax=Folsomia candida TaxID=158441 RepID=A0A226E239_FOLCA|nr:NADH-cytochrome b5 reductase 2 [Folsomia candida]